MYLDIELTEDNTHVYILLDATNRILANVNEYYRQVKNVISIGEQIKQFWGLLGHLLLHDS